ncbi:acyl-CoA N-acyltransferase [Phlegmacium glaucopus]|nr:acyl-CoA N-acyltransferase [Phlegmacium glaucopus]
MDLIYDQNFCFPLPERLENERVKLDPFIPLKHAKLIDQTILYPEIFRYLPFGPFKSADEFMNFYETRIRKDPGYILFAIVDKTKLNTNLNNDDAHKVPEDEGHNDGPLAGLIGFVNTSPTDLVTEVGPVMILPPFQRTHISSNATGLLLKYALNLPSESPPGLGLRRVVWQANALNRASVGLAERMGFKLEGVLRWERALSPSKEETGRIPREGDPRRNYFGRDTALLALCWDDWEDGGREKVDQVMERVK